MIAQTWYETAWQGLKVLLGVLVVYAVVKWDFKDDERLNGAITLAGAVSILLAGVAGLVSSGPESHWLARLGTATLMIAIAQWLRYRHLGK